ncbi:class II aldolase/adducin family protein [Eubacteriales bacterium OttesenSCG-928-N13]|nr:class II aldolase/adducin family protein [Eubacteriales bacterium OttesenSCG-928-N13]
MNFNLLHPADQLVMIMDRIYQYGMTTTSGGNLSIKDANGDIWITPSGIDKGSLTRGDIIRVTPEGEIIGIHKPSVELPFHRDIYKLRPDLGAILHAHPPTLVAFSLARRLPNAYLVPTVSLVCGEVAMAKYEVPGSEILGKYISEEFAKGSSTVMMENHGVVCGAKNLFRAFMAFETLDFCARIEIDAKKLGEPNTLTQAQINIDSGKAHPPLDAFVSRQVSSEECGARRDMCELIHRAYDQRLFNSTQGTFSQRLEDGSFLITPYLKDRKYLQPEDIVRIKGGMCESGKLPSRSALLHQKIYETHPEIGSVIIAHPPAIMAFACTDAEFDSRTIPESYIMLRDVKRLPYASSTLDPDGTAAALSQSSPVLIVANQCVIVSGTTLLNAFDRLEVLDYSAKAIIAAKDIGPIVTISEEEVHNIEAAFNLI